MPMYANVTSADRFWGCSSGIHLIGNETSSHSRPNCWTISLSFFDFPSRLGRIKNKKTQWSNVQEHILYVGFSSFPWWYWKFGYCGGSFCISFVISKSRREALRRSTEPAYKPNSFTIHLSATSWKAAGPGFPVWWACCHHLRVMWNIYIYPFI